MAAPASQEHDLPAVHVLHLLELTERWNVDADALLADLGLDRETLAAPGQRLPVATIEAVVERARAATGEPALGFYLGYQMRASWHGFLGFAAMTAATPREAIEVACRFAPTRTSALTLRLDVIGDEAALVIEERAPLGDARDVVILALVVGIWQIGSALLGQTVTGRAEVAFAEPPYFAKLAHLAGGRVIFSQPEHRLVFDRALLDQPLVMSDPAALRLTGEQLQRELDAVTQEGRFVARARARLIADDGSFRSAPELARAMHVSERTLKRKLAADDTTYSQLVTEERRALATGLLRSDDLSIDEVAARLGYSDATNFTRAFRRWTGMTPRAFRRGSS